MAPASLFTYRDRQRDRLYGTVENVWRREHGRHRDEIRALLALVDSGDISLPAAIDRVVDLDRRTAPSNAA